MREVLEVLNPFYFIIESWDKPHARTLRTGFFQKIKDTYDVFSGTLYPDFGLSRKLNFNLNFNVGLLGWLSLLILPALEFLTYKSTIFIGKIIHSIFDNNAPGLIKFAGIIVSGLLMLALVPCALIFASLFLIRNSIAAVLTLASILPFISIISFGSWLAGRKFRNTVLEAQVSINTCGGLQKFSLEEALGDQNLDNLSIESSQGDWYFKKKPLKVIPHNKIKEYKLESTSKVQEAMEELNIGNYLNLK